MQSENDNPMRLFSEKVDNWGAAEWFDRAAKAIREQDKAVCAKDEIAFETYRMIAASSLMTLVRDHEATVRAALSTVTIAEPQTFMDEEDRTPVPDGFDIARWRRADEVHHAMALVASDQECVKIIYAALTATQPICDHVWAALSDPANPAADCVAYCSKCGCDHDGNVVMTPVLNTNPRRMFQAPPMMRFTLTDEELADLERLVGNTPNQMPLFPGSPVEIVPLRYPIETAPKDGTEFLGRCSPEFGWFSCFWDGSRFAHYSHTEGLIGYPVTEWMPMPPAPAKQEG